MKKCFFNFAYNLCCTCDMTMMRYKQLYSDFGKSKSGLKSFFFISTTLLKHYLKIDHIWLLGWGVKLLA